jgi:hypothetical protein
MVMSRDPAYNDTLQLARMAFRSGPDDPPEGTIGPRHLALLDPEDLDFDLDDPDQRHIGDYELLGKLGQGGMGVVYRARQASLDREVAIKFLAAGPWASNDFIERFRREARSAARMQHPNIVEIYEIGQHDTLNFFTMRLVRGSSLAQHLEGKGPIPPFETARMLRTLAEALDYAHRLGFLHLDLKPGNILLDENGRALIADFGLAQRMDESFSVENEEVSGTPHYMAPEQAELKSRRLSPATDLWGLGAIMYEMLCANPPFSGANPQQTLSQVIYDTPAPLRRQCPNLPRDLEAICLKCLAKDPNERYGSAKALADDLGRFLDGHAVSVRQAGPIERFRRWTRREPRVAGLAVVVAVSLIAGIFATTMQWQRAEAARSQAESARIEAEASERRTRRSARMMAAMLNAQQDHASRQAQIDELMNWLEREMPGDDHGQAAQIVALANAIVDEGELATIGDLLSMIDIRIGHAFHERALAAYRDRDDPQGLFYATLLAHSLDLDENDNRQQAWQQLARASEKAPDDARIAELAALTCELHSEMECAPHYRRVAELVPDNALSWIFRLADPDITPDEQVQAVHRAANVGYFNDGFGDHIREIAEAMINSGEALPLVLSEAFPAIGIGDDPTLATAFMATWNLPMPPYSHLVQACHPGKSDLTDPDLHDSCVAIGHRLAESRGTLLGNVIGWSILRRLLPDTEIAEEMFERHRQYRWVMDQFMDVYDRREPINPDRQAEDTIIHGEFEALIRRSERYGIDRYPPEDWMPDNPDALKLPEDR